MQRDLKPQNLLLATSDTTTTAAVDSDPLSSPPPPTLKIADFGFARALGPHLMAETLCGSPLYMAPEILLSQKYDAKADLWSVGTILYEALAGKPPYTGGNQVALLRNIRDREARLPPEVATQVTHQCRSLVYSLLKRNVADRLTFEEFFEHPFFLLSSTTSSGAAGGAGGSGSTGERSRWSPQKHPQQIVGFQDRGGTGGGATTTTAAAAAAAENAPVSQLTEQFKPRLVSFMRPLSSSPVQVTQQPHQERPAQRDDSSPAQFQTRTEKYFAPLPLSSPSFSHQQQQKKKNSSTHTTYTTSNTTAGKEDYSEDNDDDYVLVTASATNSITSPAPTVPGPVGSATGSTPPVQESGVPHSIDLNKRNLVAGNKITTTAHDVSTAAAAGAAGGGVDKFPQEAFLLDYQLNKPNITQQMTANSAGSNTNKLKQPLIPASHPAGTRASRNKEYQPHPHHQHQQKRHTTLTDEAVFDAVPWQAASRRQFLRTVAGILNTLALDLDRPFIVNSTPKGVKKRKIEVITQQLSLYLASLHLYDVVLYGGGNTTSRRRSKAELTKEERSGEGSGDDEQQDNNNRMQSMHSSVRSGDTTSSSSSNTSAGGDGGGGGVIQAKELGEALCDEALAVLHRAEATATALKNLKEESSEGSTSIDTAPSFLLPNPWQACHSAALAWAEEAASEELLGNYTRSEKLYCRAGTVLHFLSAEAGAISSAHPENMKKSETAVQGQEAGAERQKKLGTLPVVELAAVDEVKLRKCASAAALRWAVCSYLAGKEAEEDY